MSSIKFRGKQVNTPILQVLCLAVIVFGFAFYLLLQPFFWLLGFRGPIYRNDDGGVNADLDGAFNRKAQP